MLGLGLASLCGLITPAGLAHAQLAESPAPQAISAEPVPTTYVVLVNGRSYGDALLLSLPDGRLLASGENFDRWNLQRPGEMVLRLAGEPYFALDRAPGYRARVVSQRQELWLDFDTSAFVGYRSSASPDRRVQAQRPAGLGGFLNYDLVTDRREQGNLVSDSLGLLPEVGVFGPWGVLNGQWLAENLTHEPGTRGGNFVRLDSSFRYDDPENLQTLQIGDAVGGSSLLGRPVRFGGLRWSRNFATQPGFVTLPQPALAGETALPSVLDIYVDGVRRQSQNIPPGPFEIDSLPVLTGRGDVELVVRDLLGREQRISQSYFTGNRQLRRGLDDYSYEAGFLRESFGRRSYDYGDFVAAGTHRYGFTDRFTGEARVEMQGDEAQTAGVGGVLALPYVGVISSAVAVSHADRGIGRQGLVSVERTIRRGLSLGARAQFSSADFSQIGLAENGRAPKRSLGANLGFSLPRVGTLGFGYFNIVNRTPDLATSVLSANFSARLPRGSLSLILLDRFEPRQDYSALLSYSLPLGRRDYASTGYRYNDSESGDRSGRAFTRVQRNLPQGEGWGYRAEVAHEHGDVAGGDGFSGQLGVAFNGPFGSYGLEAAQFANDFSAYRASVSGGFGAYAGHGFVSRKITNSFAIVETGVPDLDLLVHNQLAARTDADGVAVLPYLQPYQRNPVRIDGDRVPMDVSIQSQQMDATPYFRSAILLSMPVHASRAATLSLQLPNGQPVPAGATVQLEGSTLSAPVGRRGQVYLQELQTGTNLAEASWAGHRCRVSFDLPSEAGVQPDLGVLSCEAAQ